MLLLFKVLFLKWFRHVKVYAWPMFFVWNPHTFSVKGHHYYEARKLIKPGDILLRSYIQYLDSYFVPGEYSHAAIYIGGDDEEIIHAMTPDVQTTTLANFMRTDKFVIVRPNVSTEDTNTAIERTKSKLGVRYDYAFMFEVTDSSERLFSCSELCYYAYQKNVKELNWNIKNYEYKFFTKILFTKELFTPGDIIPTENSTAEVIYKI